MRKTPLLSLMAVLFLFAVAASAATRDSRQNEPRPRVAKNQHRLGTINSNFTQDPGGGIDPVGAGYGSCLPWKYCYENEVTHVQTCKQSGESACAYSYDNPNKCKDLTGIRHADCGRL